MNRFRGLVSNSLCVTLYSIDLKNAPTGSINLLCVPLGCFLSGPLTEPLGKRRAMQLVNIPLLLSWILFYFSTNINHLYVGLCMSGLSGGLMEAPVSNEMNHFLNQSFRRAVYRFYVL